MAGAGAGGGVDAPDVVADLVRADLGELGARAASRRAALARQRARGAAGEDEVERLDQRALHRARALAPGRVGDAACSCGDRLGLASARMPPTVSRMRSSRSSGAHAVAERVVGEHEAVAQDVGGEVGDVLGDGVVAAAQQRERLGGLDHADRPARARTPYSIRPSSSCSPYLPGWRVASVSATA